MGRRLSNLRRILEDEYNIGRWHVKEHSSSADLDLVALRNQTTLHDINLYFPFYVKGKIIKIKDYRK